MKSCAMEGWLGAMYSWDVASEILTMVNESVKECVVFGSATSARMLCKERRFQQDHSLIE